MSEIPFAAIKQDFQALHLMDFGAATADNLLNATMEIDLATRNLALKERPEMVTAMGRRVLDALTAPQFVEFSRETKFRGCPAAESKVFDSVDAEVVVHPMMHSPVIISENQQPVAIIKPFGEETCYALVDRPELGLVEGTLAAPGRSDWNTYRLLKRKRAGHAWELPLEAMEPVQPIRFTSFVLNDLEAGELPEKPVLPEDAGHEFIKAQAEEALVNAQYPEVLRDEIS